MESSNILSLVLIVALLGLEGVFAGAEIAFVASDINRVRQRALSGSRSSLIVLRLLRNPEWFLATTLTGTDICIISESVLAASIFIDICGPVEGQLYSVLVMVPVVLIFGEIIPKSICQQNPEKMADRFSWFIWIASRILYPVVYLVSRIARLAIFLARGRGNGRTYSPYITKQGLKFLLREKTDKSDLRTTERYMVRRVIDFSEKTSGSVMVPLSHVISLEENITFRDAAAQLKGKWFSRLPVYREEVYNIVGILYGFDLLRILPGSQDDLVSKYMKDAFFVPETKKASDLLLDMQKKGEQMAIVVDEYGGAIGIVTVEDLLEEIVGEIEDEYDTGEITYRKIGRGRFIFDSHMNIQQAGDILKIEFPSGNYETLGGFILDRLGRIPRKGESLKMGSVQFVIQDTDPKTIKEVMIILPNEIESA
ncbi:MAG: hemolysin family protein [Syntrophaceae bacterium]